MNRRSDETQLLLVKVVNDMRKANEVMDARALREVRSVYIAASRDAALAQRLAAALPPLDQLELIKLAGGGSEDISLTAVTAQLQEANGDTASAIESWRAVRASLPAKSGAELAKRADAAIKRLAK
jgi:hypothetical protein